MPYIMYTCHDVSCHAMSCNIIYHISYITYQISHAIYDISYIYMSSVICHISYHIHIMGYIIDNMAHDCVQKMGDMWGFGILQEMSTLIYPVLYFGVPYSGERIF